MLYICDETGIKKKVVFRGALYISKGNLSGNGKDRRLMRLKGLMRLRPEYQNLNPGKKV
jgi:hypothetical protein